MKEKKLYKIAFMGNKDHGCDIISTLESWGGSNYYPRTGSDPENVYFINDLGSIDFIHNSEMLSKEMKNFYFMFWHDYNIECQLKVGDSINYDGQDYNVDSILFDANNRCIVYKLKSFGIGVEYITNNELIPTEEYQTEEENNEYLCKNNIRRKLAIKGHTTRGKEVIELLEMMGGKNTAYHGTDINVIYTIDDKGIIRSLFFNDSVLMKMEYNIFTLEEFLEKYPFKVGDKVFDIADGDPGTIADMKWDEDISDMKYRIVFDNGDMGWFTIDTFGFLKKDKNLEKEKNMKKKLAIKGHLTRGNEVIEILEMLGGNDDGTWWGNDVRSAYFINDCTQKIDVCTVETDIVVFTLEEFLKEFPFMVGDKVVDCYGNTVTIKSMSWHDGFETMVYDFKETEDVFCAEDLELYKETIMNENKIGTANELPTFEPMFKMNDEIEYKIPDGYEITEVSKDKVFIKPIKPKYPKTYEDCCKVLGISCRALLSYTYPEVEHNNVYLTKEKHLLDSFMKLRICRNAYWKIAGEEMGLGKPWGPKSTEMSHAIVCRYDGDFLLHRRTRAILIFPTEEMRDAFYENFKNLIEQCKELL